jgi:hypothetical protein
MFHSNFHIIVILCIISTHVTSFINPHTNFCVKDAIGRRLGPSLIYHATDATLNGEDNEDNINQYSNINQLDNKRNKGRKKGKKRNKTVIEIQSKTQLDKLFQPIINPSSLNPSSSSSSSSSPKSTPRSIRKKAYDLMNKIAVRGNVQRERKNKRENKREQEDHAVVKALWERKRYLDYQQVRGGGGGRGANTVYK